MSTKKAIVDAFMEWQRGEEELTLLVKEMIRFVSYYNDVETQLKNDITNLRNNCKYCIR